MRYPVKRVRKTADVQPLECGRSTDRAERSSIRVGPGRIDIAKKTITGRLFSRLVARASARVGCTNEQRAGHEVKLGTLKGVSMAPAVPTHRPGGGGAPLQPASTQKRAFADFARQYEASCGRPVNSVGRRLA